MKDIYRQPIELKHANNRINGEHSINVQIYDDFEILSGLQPAWDRFIEEIKAEVFLTYDWCRIWWKYYGKGRDLKIFVFRKNENIVGILPLFFETIGLCPFSINVIKIVGTDFTPITVNIPLKTEHLNEIIQILLTKLNQIYEWDIIYLGQLCGKCEVVDQLEKVVKDTLPSSYNVLQKTIGEQTYIKIADSLNKQIGSFHKTKRRRMRNLYAQPLNEMITSFDSYCANEAEFAVFFNEFVHMHQEKWQNEGQAGHFGDWPDSYNFHREVAATQMKYDRLRLLRMRINNQTAGYQYSYKFGDIYCLFLNARKPIKELGQINFSTLLLCEIAKHAINDKAIFFDDMRGRYEYKLEEGGYLLPVRGLYVYLNIKVSLFRQMIWIVNTCYLKIWRRRIAPRLGIKTGPFWRWWLRTSMLSS